MHFLLGAATGAAAVAVAIHLRPLFRRHRAGAGPPVVHTAEEWGALQASRLPASGLYCFYSSATGAITTRQELMTVPIDDHAIVRGHACFDTASLVGGRLYRLRIHLERLIASAASARLPLPYAGDAEANIAKMTSVIKATCAASGKADADVRYWLTAGTGNLGLTPTGCQPGFYVLVFGGLPAMDASNGVPEAIVPESAVPLKPALLAELKSNNYMLNAMVMMEAQARGGTYGISVDASGNVRESCALNVCFVTPTGILRTPPFIRLLKGTTVRRAFELARAHLVDTAGGGLLRGVEQGPEIPAEELFRATEVFLVAGDTHAYAVTSIDGRKVGTGNPGPVFAAVQSLLKKDAATGHGADHEDLCSCV